MQALLKQSVYKSIWGFSRHTAARYGPQLVTNHTLHTGQRYQQNKKEWPSFTLRPATIKDYNDVIGMCTIEGDVLPYIYKYSIEEDNFSYLFEHNGQVIGFVTGVIHDDGEVVQARSFRMKGTYRRQGYTNMFQRWLIDIVRQSQVAPTLMFVRQVNVGPPPYGCQVKQTFDEHLCHISWPQRHHTPADTHVYRRLSEDDLEEVFDNEELCRDLFPKNLIYNQYVAYGIRKSNIKYVINNYSKIIATTTGDASLPFSPRKIQSLSTGTLSPISSGQIVYDIGIFGKNVSDLSSHVLAHLNTVTCSADVTLTIQTFDNVQTTTLNELFSSLRAQGVETTNWGTYSGQISYKKT